MALEGCQLNFKALNFPSKPNIKLTVKVMVNSRTLKNIRNFKKSVKTCCQLSYKDHANSALSANNYKCIYKTNEKLTAN